MKIIFTPEQQLKLKQLGLIVLYWIVMVRFLIVQNFMGIDLVPDDIARTKFINILRQNLAAGTGAGFAIGLFTGVTELYFIPKYLFNKTFLKITFIKIIIYFLCLIFISLVTGFVYSKLNGYDNIYAISKAWKLLNSNGVYYIMSVGFVLSLGINFLLTMQNRIGLDNFFPIVSGKYHSPKEEERIFLFVDLKSSSVMAEQLGHKRYSEMLQTCYRELSQLVIKYRGNIYQFVGDEAVITWKSTNRKNYRRSIYLFFSFIKKLEKTANYYQKEFGMVPEFKGAINAGSVMTAEVGGYLKSEIAHHGDVLNTASRMLEYAKSFPNHLVISTTVKDNLGKSTNGFKIIPKGNIKLRGKNNEKNIFVISEKT